MSITFTTKINGVRTADVDGLTKVVKHVEYTIKGEDGGQTFELPNKVELNSADPNSFVEFADLTEATVAAGAVDGVTARREPTVDGFGADVHGRVVEKLRRIAYGEAAD